MTRKGKQPGGHNPLTYHERAKLKLSNYGTEMARLTSDSHAAFGDCSLGLVPAVDPVATPSGHIYSREAIVSYLLTKSQELQRAQQEYNALLLRDQHTLQQLQQQQKQQQLENFREKHQGGVATMISKKDHAEGFQTALAKRIDTTTPSLSQSLNDGASNSTAITTITTTTASSSSSSSNIHNKNKSNKNQPEDAKQSLKRTSYWLSESQPQNYTTQEAKEDEMRRNPPPKRPPSPMSNQPLRLKDLTSMTLLRENDHERSAGGDDNGTNTGDEKIGTRGQCICAVSNKAITTQPVVLLKKSGVVLLKEVYEKIVQQESSKKIVCPITGKKMKEKDVMVLNKGTSGFAASGNVVAKKYRPTLT